MRAITYFNRGNSFPIVLEHQGKKYLVKLREGMSGKYSLLSEWLGNRMGSVLGLNTQAPLWLNLEEVEMEGLHEEVRDLIQKSRGLNIGFGFLENANELREAALDDLDKRAFQEVFLLDVLLLNIDRSPENANLLQAQGAIWPIDYESSMLFQEILDGSEVRNNPRILQCLKANPLYQKVGPKVLSDFIQKVKQIDFEKMLKEIPEILLGKETRERVLSGLEQRKKQAWKISETLEKLDAVVVVSKTEKREMANRNQALFKRNMERSKGK